MSSTPRHRPGTAGRWPARIPRARFVLVPGAGHLLPAEMPEEVNALLIEHLAAVEQDGP